VVVPVTDSQLSRLDVCCMQCMLFVSVVLVLLLAMSATKVAVSWCSHHLVVVGPYRHSRPALHSKQPVGALCPAPGRVTHSKAPAWWVCPVICICGLCDGCSTCCS